MKNDAGFVKFMRSDTTRELLRDPFALHLLAVISLRARYTTKPSLDGLTFGQALVGDWSAIGMTEKQYREAKRRLQRMGLATFRGTNRGTVATLYDARVFSLSDDRKSPKQGAQKGELKVGPFSEGECGHGAGSGATSAADKGRTEGGQRATNKQGDGEEGQNQSPPAVASAPPDETSFSLIDDCPDEPLTGVTAPAAASEPIPGDPARRHHEITQKWGAQFRESFSFDYKFDGKDAATLKRHLSASSVTTKDFLAVASAAWDRTKRDQFASACKNAATIHGLCTHWNAIRVELTRPVTADKRGTFAEGPAARSGNRPSKPPVHESMRMLNCQ